MSQKTLRVLGKNGKMLGGGAAQLRRIKERGGVGCLPCRIDWASGGEGL